MSIYVFMYSVNQVFLVNCIDEIKIKFSQLVLMFKVVTTLIAKSKC